MQRPRYKHEYLYSVELLKLTKVNELIERSPDDDNDESDINFKRSTRL